MAWRRATSYGAARSDGQRRRALVLVSGLSLLAGYYRIPHLYELPESLLALDVCSCRRRSGWLTASVGLYAAPLLFKEMALSLVFAAPLLAWYLSEPLFRPIGAEVYWVIVAAVGIIAIA